ncbi:LmeA family phospholipid-binding protein [Actinoplanes sp. CA-142083]|uniref:LmeA family phospholipid-binding protein n=1 Tax=Actinoplanes sp. CA-142083 TaxID=3239903 RepID=UPI003D8E6286
MTVSVVVLVLAAGMLSLAVPLPLVDSYLSNQVIDRVSSQVACPGALAQPPRVTVAGGPLVPQVLHGTLDELRIAVPDATLSGVAHANFVATMRKVSQPADNSTHVASMEATITAAFKNLPAAPGATMPQFRRAEDGGLTVDVVMPAEAAENVRAKLFLKMSLRGETVRSTPQSLRIFGQTIPAAQVGDLTGGVRTERLPHLPDGVAYKSIDPRRDGLHVALAGVSTTPLASLPTQVGGRAVTYAATGGLLGINTSAIGVPLTIFTTPVLSGATLTLTPSKVHILGGDHATNDPIAKLVLSQINSKDLSRTLPALPAGVTYRSVSVDSGGIRLTIGGVTVKPFSALSQPPGDHPTVFGAEDGFLTATQKGGSGDATPISLHGRPQIRGATLDISPKEIEMFGVRFPAANVLAEVTPQQTTFPLQKLPANLAYDRVEVLPDALRIHLTGKDVTLAKGSLTGGGC